jgi:MFS family permease
MVGGVLGSIAGGILADICQRGGGPHRTMTALSALALLSALPAVFFADAGRAGQASVLLVLFMTVYGTIIVAGVALVTIVVPNELRGLCLAMMVGANTFFGVALAPVSVSLLSGALGGPSMIGRALAIVCAVASVLCAGIFALARKYVPPKGVA